VSSSNSEQDRVRLMAERIARRVSQDGSEMAAQNNEPAGDVGEELSAVRATLSQLQERLAQIESHLTHEDERPLREAQTVTRRERADAPEQTGTSTGPPTFARSPWLSGIYVPAAHPSQERFGVEEAAVSELVDFFEKEKTCSIEPGGKPCDHCAMCSSRGF
jgi:hypothetical protein